ncbi:MAG TPA: septum formation inhibitor Maf [Gammaproteobacteria bacterium]|nr:septum formation inhibitor Maf [Gammaproteobacteria bacterium]
MSQSKQALLYLASASPRRAELLAQMGFDFEVLSVDVDESVQESESVEEYVVRLACDKAMAGHTQAEDKARLVLGADTAVFVNGKILGKPRDFADAQYMMRLLSGNRHQVLTAVALAGQNITSHVLQTSQVYMREITDNEIKAYWQTGEPYDKAGGYAIQGKAAAFIAKIEGSYSGIMGLPLYETAALLATANHKLFGLD